jgi:tetrahydromethanopterin S-methyltransferase subunit F
MSENKLWIVCVAFNPNIKALQKIVDLFRDDQVVIVDNSDNDTFFGLKKHENMLIDVSLYAS